MIFAIILLIVAAGAFFLGYKTGPKVFGAVSAEEAKVKKLVSSEKDKAVADIQKEAGKL